MQGRQSEPQDFRVSGVYGAQIRQQEAGSHAFNPSTELGERISDAYADRNAINQPNEHYRPPGVNQGAQPRPGFQKPTYRYSNGGSETDFPQLQDYQQPLTDRNATPQTPYNAQELRNRPGARNSGSIPYLAEGNYPGQQYVFAPRTRFAPQVEQTTVTPPVYTDPNSPQSPNQVAHSVLPPDSQSAQRPNRNCYAAQSPQAANMKMRQIARMPSPRQPAFGAANQVNMAHQPWARMPNINAVSHVSVVVQRLAPKRKVSSRAVYAGGSNVIITDEERNKILLLNQDTRSFVKMSFAAFDGNSGMLYAFGARFNLIQQNIQMLKTNLRLASLKRANEPIPTHAGLHAVVPNGFRIDMITLYKTLKTYFPHWTILLEPTRHSHLCFSRSEYVKPQYINNPIYRLTFQHYVKLTIRQQAIHDILCREALEDCMLYSYLKRYQKPISVSIANVSECQAAFEGSGRLVKFLVLPENIILHGLVESNEILSAYSLLMPLLNTFVVPKSQYLRILDSLYCKNPADQASPKPKQ